MSSMTDGMRRGLRLAIVFCLVAHFLADGLAVCLASPAARTTCASPAASGRLAAGEPHGDTAAAQAGALEIPAAHDRPVAGRSLTPRAGHLPAAFHPPQPFPATA